MTDVTTFVLKGQFEKLVNKVRSIDVLTPSGDASNVRLLNDGSGFVTTLDTKAEVEYGLSFPTQPGKINDILVSKTGTSKTCLDWKPCPEIPTTTKGDLLSRDVDENVRLPVGIANQVLAVDNSAPTCSSWKELPEVLGLDVKGEILVYNDNDTIVPFSPGTDGWVLTADSVESTGVKYEDIMHPSPPTYDDISPATTKGDLVVYDGSGSPDNVRLGVGLPNQLLGYDTTSPTYLSWQYLTDFHLFTAKGDLLSHDAGAIRKLPIGLDGRVLTANSGEITGLEWTTVVHPAPPTLNDITPTTTKGDLIVHDNGGNMARLPIGTGDDFMLTVDTGELNTCLRWLPVINRVTLIHQNRWFANTINGPSQFYWSDRQFPTGGSQTVSGLLAEAIRFNMPFPVKGVNTTFWAKSVHDENELSIKLADDAGVIQSGTDFPFVLPPVPFAGTINNGSTKFILDTPFPANTDFIVTVKKVGGSVQTVNARVILFVLH